MTKTTQDTATLWVCYDCIAVAANGETESEDLDREPLCELEGEDVTIGRMFDLYEHNGFCGLLESITGYPCGHEDREFSWSTCNGCGSTLGGSRHAMTVWLPVA